MVTAASVGAYRTAGDQVVALALRDLVAFWQTLPLDNPQAARDALLAFTPTLTDRYGKVSATLAAQWYDQERALAEVERRFRAKPSPPVDPAKPIGTTRRLAGYLWTDDPAALLPGLVDKLTEYVMQPGRDTIADNTYRDPAKARWARVPSGPTTCSWCLMLASRGAVYGNAAKAGQSSKYHGHCDCIATPSWSASDLPAGYDPDALAKAWRNAEASDTGMAPTPRPGAA